MNALVIGSAWSVWDELAQFDALDIEATVIAVNQAGIKYPGKLDYWATLHPSKYQRWADHRYGRKDHVSYGRMPAEGIDRVLKDRWPGSSGLYGVQIALEVVGADRVYLCGVPMTQTPHFHCEHRWNDSHRYHKGWFRAYDTLKGRVKSFSGWTKDLLGHPDDWHDAR